MIDVGSLFSSVVKQSTPAGGQPPQLSGFVGSTSSTIPLQSLSLPSQISTPLFVGVHIVEPVVADALTEQNGSQLPPAPTGWKPLLLEPPTPAPPASTPDDDVQSAKQYASLVQPVAATESRAPTRTACGSSSRRDRDREREAVEPAHDATPLRDASARRRRRLQIAASAANATARARRGPGPSSPSSHWQPPPPVA